MPEFFYSLCKTICHIYFIYHSSVRPWMAARPPRSYRCMKNASRRETDAGKAMGILMIGIMTSIRKTIALKLALEALYRAFFNTRDITAGYAQLIRNLPLSLRALPKQAVSLGQRFFLTRL